MSKLLGFYVIRSKHGKGKNPVWCGITEKERESHKQWILDNVSNEEFDGITTFDDVESNIIIHTIGQTFIMLKGSILIIESITGIHATGYFKKQQKHARRKLWQGYINGQNIHNQSLDVE